MANLKAKVLTSFLKDGPVLKGQLGDRVIKGIGDHAGVFTTPTPTLLEMTQVNNALKTATSKALSGDIEMIAIREAAEEAWDATFGLSTGAAEYVNGVAKGNPAIIAQSGFSSTKTEKGSHPLPGFTTVKKIVGNVKKSGTILFDCSHTEFAKGYVFFGNEGHGLEVKIENNTIVVSSTVAGQEGKVIIGVSTRAKYVLGTFPKAKMVNCGVLASNSKGFGAASHHEEIVVP